MKGSHMMRQLPYGPGWPYSGWTSRMSSFPATCASLSDSAAELGSHGSRHVELAVHEMTRGEFAGWFRAGAALGVVLPAALVVIALATDTTSPALAAVAGASALAGMFLSETAFVRAGQAVPLS